MFGYIVVNKPELKFKEFDIYHSYYCGLCRVLKNKYGLRGQISLNFDMTFLAILLTGLYEPDTKLINERCIMHPIKKHWASYNEYVDYAAKMTIVLTYFKCEDDWLDEQKITKQVYKKLIKKAYIEIKNEYPDKVNKIEKCLHLINSYEKQKIDNLDKISNYFGEVLGNIFTYKKDEWNDELYEMGHYLGRFIYFIDAYEDIEDDLKKGNYNPFINYYKKDDFDDRCKEILELMISESTMYFEKLPIIKNATIIRNILYSGVWTKYELIKKKRMEGKK